MDPILKKLHLTSGKTALILNSPDEFLETVKSNGIDAHTEVEDYYTNVLFFANNLDEVEELLNEASNAIETDGVMWFCYPKASNELTEKSVFNILGEYDLVGVAKVSLNDNWIALRIQSDDEDFDFETEKGGKFKNVYDD